MNTGTYKDGETPTVLPVRSIIHLSLCVPEKLRFDAILPQAAARGAYRRILATEAAIAIGAELHPVPSA